MLNEHVNLHVDNSVIRSCRLLKHFHLESYFINITEVNIMRLLSYNKHCVSLHHDQALCTVVNSKEMDTKKQTRSYLGNEDYVGTKRNFRGMYI